MLRLFYFAISFSLISACALGPESFFGRGLASDEQSCALIKHPREAIYQVHIGGRPYSEFWYDQAYGQRILDKLREDGRCRN